MIAQSGAIAGALGLLALAGASVWCVLLLVLSRASAPPRPVAGPAVQELPGDEPPAVVNLLVSGCRLQAAAVPATLLDLAARRAVAIERVDLDSYQVRVQPDVRAALSDYEEQLLGHVRSLAGADHVVPAGALTTGPADRSAAWWSRFRKAVEQDATARGLVRARWSAGALTTLGVVAAFPGAFAALALVFSPGGDRSSIGNAIGVTAFLALMAGVGAPGAVAAHAPSVETDAGAQRAGAWLGTRTFLQNDGTFPDQPPYAVAVWGRYLGYGAALGVAATAVRALPMGAESDTEAWSRVGGRWHVVRVRYPKVLPPGWGWAPWQAVAAGLLALPVGRLALLTTGGALSILRRIPPELSRGAGGIAVAVLSVVGAGMLLVPAGATAYGVALLVRGLGDLVGPPRAVEGVAVRLRTVEKYRWLAVDDGSAPSVRAWRMPSGQSTGHVAEGAAVRVTVTPHLGRVRSVDPAH